MRLALGFKNMRQSRGVSYGPELVTNGTFTTDTTGWAATNATLSVVGGEMQVLATAAGAQADQNVSGLTIGATYNLRTKMTPGNASNFAAVLVSGGHANTYYFRTSGQNLDVSFVLAGVAGVNLFMRLLDDINGFGGVGEASLFDNISLRRVL